MNQQIMEVLIFIAGICFTVLSGVTVYLFTRSQDHEKRIQRIEDVQGNKIDTLVMKVDGLEKAITDLSANVHKEKNIESQFTATLKAILDFMETHHVEPNR